MRFASRLFLLLLLLVPLLIRRYRAWTRIPRGTLRFSDLSRVRRTLPAGWAKYYRFFPLLRILTIVLLILALARPQSSQGDEAITTEGIDIILTLDISGSMRAEDFDPNRLEAAKKVAADFIAGRKNDRIGLVVFAGHSVTQAPLTLDYQVLLALLDTVQIGMLQEDGTAIGMAIANSVNRLRESEAKSKVIILLTDGVNNRGEIAPITAANLAKALNINIYTIGAGTKGVAHIPIDDPVFGRISRPVQVDIDEDTLQEVAELTGGAYFRATDEESLANIYEEIDRLEKSKVSVKQYKEYTELFPYLVYLALGLLGCELLLTHTRFRKIP